MKAIAGYLSLLIAIAEFIVFKSSNDITFAHTGQMTMLSIAGMFSAFYCFSEDSEKGLNKQASQGCAAVASFIQLLFSLALFVSWSILALRWLGGVKGVSSLM